MTIKKINLLLFLSLLSCALFSQAVDSTIKGKQTLPTDTGDIIYQFVEEMATFPGGDKAMYDHFAKNTVYPALAKEKNIQGTVFVQFVVEKDGTITNISIKQSTAPECNEAALTVVRSMPRWNPGKQRGKPIRLMYVLPVKFQLDSGKSGK